jgi:hypothetical protein
MSLESILENIGKTETPTASPELIIKRLAVNKPLRIFLQSINGMNNIQFASLVSDCKTLFTIAQNDMIMTKDSGILEQITRVPHFVAFIERLSGI